jgi:nitrate/nitrite transporter NarK
MFHLYIFLIQADWVGTFFCGLSFLCALVLVNVIPDEIFGNSNDSTMIPLISGMDSQHEHTDSVLREYYHLPKLFHILCVTLVFLYGTVVPFNTIANDFLIKKYSTDTKTAGFIMSLPDLISSFLVPVFGTVADLVGYRISLLFACSVMLTISHLSLGLTDLAPIPFFIMLGVAYAMYGVIIWPSIGMVIIREENRIEQNTQQRKKLVGFAFGVSSSLLNTMLTVLPIIVANVIVASSYIYVELLFALIGFLGVIACCWAYQEDFKTGSLLQLK